ncbi:MULTISPECIES: hypothetical protein [unclassified Nostoc]|nr:MULTISPECIES: hypothetical protein [unclassified Nostoc]MDZ8126628.1 hypothetical protein [Nostoc sp. CmiVER01]MDZ8227853.1 hypothetical protein [Nostoc sp. ChiVER01]
MSYIEINIDKAYIQTYSGKYQLRSLSLGMGKGYLVVCKLA